MRDQAIEQLSQIGRDESRYSSLLTNLIAQALYRLIEKEVIIKCKEKDLNLVNVNIFPIFVLFNLII